MAKRQRAEIVASNYDIHLNDRLVRGYTIDHLVPITEHYEGGTQETFLLVVFTLPESSTEGKKEE